MQYENQPYPSDQIYPRSLSRITCLSRLGLSLSIAFPYAIRLHSRFLKSPLLCPAPFLQAMSQTARNRLNFLWQRIILQKALKTTEVHDHVAGLELFNITHNTQVEIEENADKSLLFEAMDQQRLGKYPVDPTEAKEDCPFPEYDPAGKVREYTSAICEVVERWGCLGSLRPSILSDLHVRDLQETMSIRTMRYDQIVLSLCTSITVKLTLL